MLTELLMQDERRAGREEGRIKERKDSVFELLSDLGSVPDTVQKRIMQETDLEKLRAWTKLAAKVSSIDQFEKEM